jgi:hypothetical protein
MQNGWSTKYEFRLTAYLQERTCTFLGSCYGYPYSTPILVQVIRHISDDDWKLLTILPFSMLLSTCGEDTLIEGFIAGRCVQGNKFDA